MYDVKLILESHRNNCGLLQKTKIESISHLLVEIMTDGKTGLHSLSLTINNSIAIPDLNLYKFVGTQLFLMPDGDKNVLLLLLLEPDLKDIFVLFVENLIKDLEQADTEIEAVNILFNLIAKWKRLFNKQNKKLMSIEAQKGLMGELLFMNCLLDKQILSSVVVEAWSGDDYDDKDFNFQKCSVEIKFSSSKVPTLKISSERQLDIKNIDVLFLLLYHCDEVKAGGKTLGGLVDEIKAKLLQTPNELQLFEEKLVHIGFFDEDKDFYTRQYKLYDVYTYIVEDGFPRIKEGSFPIGIFNITYNIEMSLVEKYRTNIDTIIDNI